MLGTEQHAERRAPAGGDEGRFRGVRWEAEERGAVFVHGSVTWFDRLRAGLSSADCAIAQLEVGHLWTTPAADTSVFHGRGSRSLARVERSAVPA